MYLNNIKERAFNILFLGSCIVLLIGVCYYCTGGIPNFAKEGFFTSSSSSPVLDRINDKRAYDAGKRDTNNYDLTFHHFDKQLSYQHPPSFDSVTYINDEGVEHTYQSIGGMGTALYD